MTPTPTSLALTTPPLVHAIPCVDGISGGRKGPVKARRVLDIAFTDLPLALNRFSTAPSTAPTGRHRLGRTGRPLDFGATRALHGNPLSEGATSFQELALIGRTSRLHATMTLRPSSLAPLSEAVPAWDGLVVEGDDPLPGSRSRSRAPREWMLSARSALTMRFRPDADPVPPSSCAIPFGGVRFGRRRRLGMRGRFLRRSDGTDGGCQAPIAGVPATGSRHHPSLSRWARRPFLFLCSFSLSS